MKTVVRHEVRQHGITTRSVAGVKLLLDTNTHFQIMTDRSFGMRTKQDSSQKQGGISKSASYSWVYQMRFIDIVNIDVRFGGRGWGWERIKPYILVTICRAAQKC